MVLHTSWTEQVFSRYQYVAARPWGEQREPQGQTSTYILALFERIKLVAQAYRNKYVFVKLCYLSVQVTEFKT